MKSLDERLSEALKQASTALQEERGARPRRHAELIRRYRRRRVLRFTTAAVVVASAASLAAFATTTGGIVPRPGPAPATHVPAPPAGTYIAVGKDPVGVSVTQGAVWVVSRTGLLAKVDPATNRGVLRVPVGGKPSDVALTPTAIWFSDSADGSVKRIDPTSNVFVGAPVFVGSHGHIDVDVGPQGTVWATDHDSSALIGIDSTTGDETRRFDVVSPVELGIGLGGIWALSDDGRSLTRFDFGTGAQSLQTAVDDTTKTDLAVTADAVFVAEADGTVLDLDPATGAVSATYSTGGVNPELAVGRGILWIASDTGGGIGELVQLDASNLRALAPARKFIGAPTDIALGDGSVWVTESNRDTVVRLRAPRR